MGETATGEGLLGIQRAFQVAGARSTVASLWKVSDEGTRLLMTRFYDNLWDKGLSPHEALREAQLWFLRSPDERWRSRPGQEGTTRVETHMSSRSSPYYWAAFQSTSVF